MSRLSRQHVARWALHAGFCVLLVAAVAKLASLDAFARSLYSWDLLPPWSVPTLSLVIPVAEGIVAGLWFLGEHRRLATQAYVALLAAFTIALGAHLALARPPSCHCFGLMLRFEASVADATWAIVRNGVLIALICGASLLQRGSTSSAGPTRAKLSARRGTPRRAFTIIEILIGIALIAVLLSIVIPSMRGVRRGAQSAVSLTHLRQHATTLHLYSGDNAESFPFLTDPYASFTTFRTPSGTASVQFFELHLAWNFPLSAEYYGGDPFHESFRMPYAEFYGASAYYYADCFIARPEYWNPSTRVGPAQWSGTRQSDVLFPSLKGMVRERHSWIVRDTGRSVQPGSGERPPEPVRFVRVDGASGAASTTGFLPVIPSGPGQSPPVSYLSYGLPIMHTLNGVRGRDVP
ncbi:MAG: prepilin-type N-terminal cleavage/methylation domain-containing protein [Phycisphaerales bacterium]|nr:prepilin-type N-terminal cleavage/methylation domain-containing protein [Phycisphaerales bacterium]